VTHVGDYDVVKHSEEAAYSVRAPALQPRMGSVGKLGMLALAGSCMLLTCVEQWRLLQHLLTRHMNADHALLWLAAREWSRLSVHEPTFYGQTYGVLFEGIPIALLHAVGLSYTYALPLALFLLAWSAWLWLAASAFRRKMPVAGLTALAAPCLLSVKHWIVVGVIGTGVGRLLAAVCAGLILRGISRPSQAFRAVTLGGLAVAFDSASLVLAGPALLWAGWTRLRLRRYWLPTVLGLLAPAAWVALNIWFTRLHPDHDMHANWSFMPELEPLLLNLADPDPLFAVQSLELCPSGALIHVLLLILLGLALCARAWREAAAVSCVLAQLTYLAALDKSLDEIGTLWFPAARMTLGVPMAVWFVAAVTLQACWMRWQQRRPAWTFARQLAVPLLLLLVLSSASVRALHWDKQIFAIAQRGMEPKFLELSRPWDIAAICAQAQRSAQAWGTEIVAFPTQGTANYACPALYPELVTVFPSYERRYWILNQLAQTTQGRMILWGKGEKFCRTGLARELFTQCQPAASGHALAVAWEKRDPLQVLRALRYKVRPFGPGCSPKDTRTCGWWFGRYYPSLMHYR
jgi:hypothetical protein